MPLPQVSVCVAWSPDGIDGRNYDIPAFAKAADLVYGEQRHAPLFELLGDELKSRWRVSSLLVLSLKPHCG